MGDATNDGSDFRDTGSGAGTGTGAAACALAALVGTGVDTAKDGVGTAAGVLPSEIAPFSRLTSFGGAVLPEKNSPAESAGSDEGARR
jgi:hypothetical protein